jgi:hypothetical protein
LMVLALAGDSTMTSDLRIRIFAHRVAFLTRA